MYVCMYVGVCRCMYSCMYAAYYNHLRIHTSATYQVFAYKYIYILVITHSTIGTTHYSKFRDTVYIRFTTCCIIYYSKFINY